MTSVLVLAYHRVNGIRPADGLVVSPYSFRRQMQILRALGFSSLTVEAAVKAFRSGLRVPKRTVIITFDDGYRDNYLWARPILKEFGYTATFFIAASFCDTDEIFPWDQVKGWTHIYDEDLPMTSVQLRSLQEEGFEIGSHGMTHRNLTDLDPHEVYRELMESKGLLEHVTMKQVVSFCYPRGLFTQEISRVVKEVGYHAAVVTPRSGMSLSAVERVFAIPRSGIYSGDSTLSFLVKISPIWKLARSSWLGNVVRKTHGLLHRRSGHSLIR